MPEDLKQPRSPLCMRHQTFQAFASVCKLFGPKVMSRTMRPIDVLCEEDPAEESAAPG